MSRNRDTLGGRIKGWLEMSDYTGFTTKDVAQVVTDLQSDPFIVKLAQTVKA